MNFRPDIQGLRAVAVLSVMVFHFNAAWLSGGFVGVDIFFVISGFLITGILLKKQQSHDYRLKDTLNYFYLSRIKRIFPAYYVLLAIVTVVAAILYIPQDLVTFLASLAHASIFNANHFFAGFGDYFAPANHEQPLLHTWSLAVEIQFYLLAPFIVLLTPRRWLPWLLILASIVLLLLAEYRLRFLHIEQQTYYSLYARLPEFFIGALVAIFLSNRKPLSGQWLPSLGLSLIALSVTCQPKLGLFPGILVLVPTLGAALLLISQPIRWLSSALLVWIGSLSYSLYLWHWPVLAFLRYYTGAEVLDVYHAILFVVATLLLSAASYYWIEEPLRKNLSPLRRNIIYASLVVAIVVTGVNLKAINTFFSPPPLAIEYTRYADPDAICHGKIVGDCLKGDLNSDKEILVLGDSHAAMLNHFFDYLGKELGFKARIITASSCVTVPGFDYQRIPEWAHQPCLAQIEEANKQIAQAQTIVIAALWSYQLTFESFNQVLLTFLIEQQNKEVILLPQIPTFAQNPQRTERFEFMGLQIDNKTSANQGVNKLLEQIAQQAPKASVYSLVDFKLLDRTDLMQLYFDESHLNEYGAKIYAKEAAQHWFRQRSE